MAQGLYRDNAGWVHVAYDHGFEMTMHRSDYEDHGYKPRFETLPVRASREKSRAHPAAPKKN